MALTIGIVGLPNVGKSTLFNALTKNDVLAANYPFATIEPNVGVVGVPDPRLGVLAEIFGSERQLPATVSFVDIAGIVRGASEGAGLGNKFLANIRESDAICQVIRVFTDPDVVHVDGEVSPKDDIETINTELILADLQTVEKAMPAAAEGGADHQGPGAGARGGRGGVRGAGAPAPRSSRSGLDREPLRELLLLTAKPFLYVFNVDADELSNEPLKDELRGLVAPAEAVFLDAKTEADLAELDDEDALELLAVDRPDGVRARRPSPGSAFDTLGPADVPHGRPEGVPRLDDPQGRHRARGGRCHPHRLPEGLHQGRGHLLRRPRRRRLGRGGPRRRQGAHGGQGLRDGRRRRGGVPLQRVTRGHQCPPRPAGSLWWFRIQGGVTPAVGPSGSAMPTRGDRNVPTAPISSRRSL